MTEFPKRRWRMLQFAELVEPLRAAALRILGPERVAALPTEPVPWTGPDHIQVCAHVVQPPSVQLGRRLPALAEMGRDPVTVLLETAVLLGMEQGYRMRNAEVGEHLTIGLLGFAGRDELLETLGYGRYRIRTHASGEGDDEERKF